VKKEQIGNSTLYLCDCMDLMATLPDKSIDLAVVDPPYGIGFDKEYIVMSAGIRKDGTKRICKAWKHRNPKGYAKKDWDRNTPTKDYFNELFRVSKKQIICGGNYYDLPKTGGWIIWDKCVVMPTLSKCELLWTSFLRHTEIYKLLWAGYRRCEQVERIHPTQKPVQLYKKLLVDYAKQGDKILDTHFGSGSIAIACNELGFDLTASEIDKDYFSAACKRIKEANKQSDLFREAV